MIIYIQVSLKASKFLFQNKSLIINSSKVVNQFLTYRFTIYLLLRYWLGVSPVCFLKNLQKKAELGK